MIEEGPTLKDLSLETFTEPTIHISHYLAHTKLDLMMLAQLEAHNPDMNLINQE